MVKGMIIICIPIARREISASQYCRFLKVRDSLVQSLTRTCTNNLQYQIRIVFNGPPVRNDCTDKIINAFRNFPMPKAITSIHIIKCEKLGKIPAINSAILDPNTSGIVVLDDDVLIPPQAFQEINNFLRVRRQHFEALCFTKVPVYPYASSTEFATQINFLLHPSVQRVLIDMGFFHPFRPTGSFYAIHNDHISPFPNPCNEADMLANRRVKMSYHFVRTWYPDSFEDEVIRRKKHIFTTRNSGHIKSAKPLETIATYNRVIHPPKLKLTPQVNYRIHQALETMRTVMVAAEKEAFNV